MNPAADALTLAGALAGVVLASLTAYVLLGGADFGGGVWDLLASGPRRDAQRELVAHAIGPIWEANHVWLILVVVLLFTCFPPAFAAIATALHIPLTLMLVGIVLRGSAFTFRAYGGTRDAVTRRWGIVFSIASVVTPVLLGVCVGALASGRVGRAIAGPTAAGFADLFLRPWLTSFAIAVGVLALALFAFLAATYLTVEAADDAALREDFRVRALGAGVAVFVTAFAALAAAYAGAPAMRLALTESTWAVPLHLATGIAAVTALWALWTRHFRVARIAAAAQVSFILWGWAAAQYPYLVPPTYRIGGSAAPARTLRLVAVTLAAGFAVLLPSLAYLFRVFKGGTPVPGRRPGFTGGQ